MYITSYSHHAHICLHKLHTKTYTVYRDTSLNSCLSNIINFNHVYQLKGNKFQIPKFLKYKNKTVYCCLSCLHVLRTDLARSKSLRPFGGTLQCLETRLEALDKSPQFVYISTQGRSNTAYIYVVVSCVLWKNGREAENNIWASEFRCCYICILFHSIDRLFLRLMIVQYVFLGTCSCDLNLLGRVRCKKKIFIKLL